MNFSVIKVQVSSLMRDFAYRPKTSDEGVIQQMFVNCEYNIGRLRRVQDLATIHNNIIAQKKAPLIIDAGANIGASAVYFCGTFPSSRVIALEPEQKNHQLLVHNTQGLNVACLHAALSASKGQLDVINPNQGNWGFRTQAEPSESDLVLEKVTCIGINDIYASCTTCIPFIVKIDIEGGENDLFSAHTDWIEKTPLIIIELHDWLMPRSASSRNFLKCISQTDRDFVYIGENVFSISNTILA